jgi:hypothetical protein
MKQAVEDPLAVATRVMHINQFLDWMVSECQTHIGQPV